MAQRFASASKRMTIRFWISRHGRSSRRPSEPVRLWLARYLYRPRSRSTVLFARRSSIRTRKSSLRLYAQAPDRCVDPSQQTINALMKLNLPAGVDIEIAEEQRSNQKQKENLCSSSFLNSRLRRCGRRSRHISTRCRGAIMIEGLLGRKIGMTQVFSAAGEAIPVTVIEVGPCVVTQIRNKERDGYEAVQIGFGEVKPKA